MSAGSIELASTYISVGISTEGLGKDILKRSQGIGAAFGKVGQQGGNAFSSAFSKSSAGATKGAVADQAVLAKAVESSTKKVAQARTGEAAAARKVGIEEAKLQELRSSGAKDSQILAAEDRLQTARTKQALATAKTTVEVDKLKGAQKELRGASDDAAQGAEQSGSRIGRAFAKLNPFAGMRAKAKQEGEGAGNDFGTSIESSATKSKGRLGVAGVALGNAIGGGLLGVASKIGRGFADAIKGSITAASDLEQSIGGVGAVFGKDAAQIETAAMQAATSMGMSRNSYNELATTVGAGLKNKGITDYAGETQKLLGLGGDLAAQFGGSTTEAVEALSSLMRGESDPIERYGVSINETAVNAELAAKGQSNLTGAALESAKAQARLDLVMRQTADAQGAFARESNTFAGVQARATAQWEDLQAKIGTAFLPILTKAMGFVSNIAIPALDGLVVGIGGVASILGSGDFKGADMTFGLEEDSPVIGFLFNVREAVIGITSILGKGDFTGGIFGLEEDSALVGFLFNMRDAFFSIGDAIDGFVVGFGGMDAVISAFSAILPVLMGPLGILKDALLQVFGGEGSGVNMTAFGLQAGQALGPVVTVLAEVAGVITGSLATALAELLPVVMQVAGTLASTLGSALQQLAPIIAQIAMTLLPILAKLLSTLVPVIMQVVSAVLPLVAMLISQLAPVFLQLITILLPPLSMLLEAVVGIVSTLVAALAPVITAFVSQLAPILVMLVQTLLPPLARVIAMVAEVISTILAPVLTVIINVLGTLLVGAINALMPIVATVFGFIARTIGNVMDVISGIIRLVMAVIRGDWDGAWAAIQQIGAAIWDQIKNVIETAINLVLGVIRGVLTILQTIWNAAWEVIKAVGQAAWNWILSGISLMRDLVIGVVTFLVNAVIANFTSFRDNIAALAGTIRDWVVERFEALKTGAEATFQAMVDGIGAIWDGLKAVAAAPVRFVIDTVINDGIIKGWNDLVGLLKLPDDLKIANINVPGFIRGGVLPGRGTSSGDDMVVMDRHGRPQATVASGEPVLSRDMYARNRGVVDSILAGNRVPGFWMGGTLPTPGPVRPHRMPYYGARYAADMGGGTGSPVYAWNDGTISQTMLASTSYGNRIRANHGDLGQTLYAHLSQILVTAGQVVRAGQLIGRIGYSGNVRPPGPGGAHLHFEILGGNAPISGDSGSEGGGFFDMAGQWITDRLSAPVKALIERVPGAGVFVDAAKGMGTRLLEEAVKKIRDLIPDFGFDDSMSGQGASGSKYNNAVLLMQAGKALGASRAAMRIALATADVESSMGTDRAAMTPPADSNGDHGWFQGRVSRGDGTFAQLSDPLYALRVFLMGKRVPAGYHVPGLYNIRGWEGMDPGRAAQRVQVSAYPARYSTRMGLADTFLNQFGYASGTRDASAGWHLVGERGPELMRFRGGEQVADSPTTREVMDGMSGPEIHVHTNDEFAAAHRVMDALRWSRAA